MVTSNLRSVATSPGDGRGRLGAGACPPVGAASGHGPLPVSGVDAGRKAARQARKPSRQRAGWGQRPELDAEDAVVGGEEEQGALGRQLLRIGGERFRCDVRRQAGRCRVPALQQLSALTLVQLEGRLNSSRGPPLPHLAPRGALPRRRRRDPVPGRPRPSGRLQAHGASSFGVCRSGGDCAQASCSIGSLTAHLLNVGSPVPGEVDLAGDERRGGVFEGLAGVGGLGEVAVVDLEPPRPRRSWWSP